MADQTDTVQSQDDHQSVHEGDAFADAMAAVALVAIFVIACVYWVSGQ